MLRRRKPRRIVDMTNEEAACFYVVRAQSAANRGEYGRALHLYQTAALHDPSNIEASKGVDMCQALLPPPGEKGPDTVPLRTSRRRHRRRRWWKRLLPVS